MERDTRQRGAIRAAIENAAHPMSPQEILVAAQRDVPAMNLATVYRNIKAMQEEGALSAIYLPGESARFEAAHLEHHHHFRCNRCERVYDVHGCGGTAIETAPAGFTVERHELTLYGTCAACNFLLGANGVKRRSQKTEHSHDCHDHASHSVTKPLAKSTLKRPSESVVTQPRRTKSRAA